jgi:hypothetical protein
MVSTYDAVLTVRVPKSIAEGVSLAAEKQMTKPAEYLRRAIIECLRNDGMLSNSSRSVYGRRG